MADNAAELAFLEAQKEYDPAGDYSHLAEQPEPADGDGDDDEYDPASAFSSTANNQPPHDGPSPSGQSNSIPPESAANTPSPADGGLKPQPADASAAPAPSKQPRTVGGFVVESEDDEDEVPVAKPKTAGSALLNASANATGIANSPQRSLTHSPNNTLPQPDVPFHNAQDQGAPAGVSSSSLAVNDSAQPVASPAVPNSGTPVPDATKPGAPVTVAAPSGRQSTAPATPTAAALPTHRLPNDTIGILEDRIEEDPRGDIEAWLGLIEEHRRRHKLDDARIVFERFFQFFPTAAEQWVQYANMESELDNFSQIETLFNRSIMTNPHVSLWSCYIDYIRRRYNLTTDTTGAARQTVNQVYDFALQHIGIDVNSGKIWLDYINLMKEAPGVLGGSSWKDMQKMDTLRKIYQRAVAVPTTATLEIWREYGKFEDSLNKATGRKYLQERSAAYMTARAAINVLENITKDVNRTTLPKLPPAVGFDGHDEYMKQVKLWKNWIQWEKDDPLEIKEDDRDLYNKRVLFLYKNALMALRFWSEMWYDAAEWCFQNGLQEEGDKFLDDGLEANPESCLLAFKKANQVELRTDFDEGEQGALKKGLAIRAVFDTLLDALYSLTNKTRKREEHTISRTKDMFAAQQKADELARANAAKENDEDEEDLVVQTARQQKEKEEALERQLKAISAGFNAQIHELKRTLSYAWIALMRAMRRVQGKGGPNAPVPGFRGVFADARRKGKLLSDAYVASALIEHHCYQDPAATKIFERGLKLFPEDEHFALEYIKHLIKLNDATNARAVFETVVTKLTAKPENVARTKPLFVYFHEYESQYGELAQITKIEQRMATLFPEDPQLLRFTQRFATNIFDPTAVHPIISPRAQMRPVMPNNVMPSVEEPVAPPPPPVQPQEQRIASPALVNSPRLQSILPAATNSPKRPLDDVDNEIAQPRKLMRGESPLLKGAAGRRLEAKRNQPASGGGNTPVGLPPAPLPRDINFLLSIIPPAHTYPAEFSRFNPEKIIAIIRGLPGIPLPPGTAAQPAHAFGPPHQPSPQQWSHMQGQLQDIQARYGSQQVGWQR